MVVKRRNRCRNEDFFCPFEQFFFGNFGNADVVTSGLKNNHADGLNVVQAFKEIESTEGIHPHLAVVFGFYQNSQPILEIYYRKRTVSYDNTVGCAEAL